MRKWIIGLIMIILTGIIPLTTYAASGKPELLSAAYRNDHTSLQQKRDKSNQEDEDEKRKKRERLEKERREKERKEQERKEKERKEQERRERERKEYEQRERERKEQERRERERKEYEQRERERWEQEKREQERREQERKERERKEYEKRERERKEQEKREQERREWERREAKRREWERWENEYRDVKFRNYWHIRNHKQEQEDCRYVIHRTSQCISFAQSATALRHYNRGLALAIAHQMRAIELYHAGFYWSAIYHSLRARNLAMNVIKNNRETWFELFVGDAREERYLSHGPGEVDLDLLIDLNSFGNDETMVKVKFELDIKD